MALHLGHRRSADLDWFSPERPVDPMGLAQDIRDGGIPLVIRHVDRGTLHGEISGVRVTFLRYAYRLLEPPASWPGAAGAPEGCACRIAAPDDLACMKLSAVAQWGAKRDFVDIYALGKTHRSLPDMLHLYRVKYAIEDIGHVLYALAYFDDADPEPMPEMLWDADWQTVKRTIQRWVREVAGEG